MQFGSRRRRRRRRRLANSKQLKLIRQVCGRLWKQLYGLGGCRNLRQSICYGSVQTCKTTWKFSLMALTLKLLMLHGRYCNESEFTSWWETQRINLPSSGHPFLVGASSKWPPYYVHPGRSLQWPLIPVAVPAKKEWYIWECNRITRHFIKK